MYILYTYLSKELSDNKQNTKELIKMAWECFKREETINVRVNGKKIQGKNFCVFFFRDSM